MREAQERADKYDDYIEEECKNLGKTVEQYWAEHPQRSVVSDYSACNCDGTYIISTLTVN